MMELILHAISTPYYSETRSISVGEEPSIMTVLVYNTTALHMQQCSPLKTLNSGMHVQTSLQFQALSVISKYNFYFQYSAKITSTHQPHLHKSPHPLLCHHQLGTSTGHIPLCTQLHCHC